MAEIKVKVTGDNSGFKRAMVEASASSRAFAGQARENISGVGDTLSKIAGQSGFGKFATLLGLGGIGGAVVAFGASLVSAVKGGVEQFEKLENATARAASAFGNKGIAFQLKEWAQQNAGALPPDELISAATKIRESGPNISLEKAQDVTTQLRGASAYTGESLGDLAELYAKGQSHDFTNLGRMFRSNPGLREIFKEDLPEFPDIDKASTAGQITPEIFDRVLAKENAAGGRFQQARQDQSGTLSSTVGRLQVAINKVEEAIGEGLAPALKSVTQELTHDFGSLSSQAKAFGENIGKAIDNIDKILNSPAIKLLTKEGGAERGIALNAAGKVGDLFNALADATQGRVTLPANKEGSPSGFQEMKDSLHRAVFNLEDSSKTLKDVVSPKQ